MAKEFAKPFYKSVRWQRCRDAYIKSVNGLCENCLVKGKIVPGYIVHHKIELDEINITGVTYASQYRDGWIRHFEINPQEYGFSLCSPEAIRGGDATTNAGIILRVLEGEKGPAREIVILNAAAAILVADLASDFGEAIAIASRSIDSGSAMAALDRARSAYQTGK